MISRSSPTTSCSSSTPAHPRRSRKRARPRSRPDEDVGRRSRGHAPELLGCPAAAQPGDEVAAIGRGIIDGVPVAGPYMLAGVNRAVAGIRALKNDSRYSDELKAVETSARARPKSTRSQTSRGTSWWRCRHGPARHGRPGRIRRLGAALPVRMAASGVSGAALGAADSAVRSGGDLGEIEKGAAIGGGLGLAGPAVGAGVGKAWRAITGGEPGMHLLREAAHGLSESELASAQAIRDAAANSPGGPVGISVDEALNAATGGKATRASQLARCRGELRR